MSGLPIRGKRGGKVPTGVLPARPVPPRGGSTPRPMPECIGCGAEPGEECTSWCDTDCRACADEAEGWYGKPHTCEDEW